jgi:hypothetical protein
VESAVKRVGEKSELSTDEWGSARCGVGELLCLPVRLSAFAGALLPCCLP